MGWWKDGQNAELELGDVPFDLAHAAIKDISSCYLEERGRKPSMSELVRTLEEILTLYGDVYLSDLAESEVSKLIVKTVKRKKKQNYVAGDYFAVPVTEATFVFGRILQNDENGCLVEIYDAVSPELRTPSQLSGGHRLFRPVYVAPYVLENWEWRILGGGIGYSTNKFEYPAFKVGNDLIGWEYWRGPNTKRLATPEEVATLEGLRLWTGNSLKERIALATGCWGLPAIEERIRQGDMLFETGQHDAAISEWYIAQQYASYIPQDTTAEKLGHYAKKRIEDTRARKGAPLKN